MSAFKQISKFVKVEGVGRLSRDETFIRTMKDEEHTHARTHLYFMPVCLPVDSLSEMCRGVKEPKLRAMMATVRNLARAWLTTLGLVAFCLLCSPLPRFRLWSVQAMDTCMAAAFSRRPRVAG